MSEPITRIEAVALARKIMAKCEAAVAFDEIYRLEAKLTAATKAREQAEALCDKLMERVAKLSTERDSLTAANAGLVKDLDDARLKASELYEFLRAKALAAHPAGDKPDANRGRE